MSDESNVNALELATDQTAFVNDQRKQELEEAFPGRYAFAKIEHHDSLNPVNGADVAWLASNAAVDEEQPVEEPAVIANRPKRTAKPKAPAKPRTTRSRAKKAASK